MGLGIHLISDQSFVRPDQTNRAFLEQLASHLASAVSDTRFKPFVSTTIREEGVDLELHPAEEPVEFILTESGRLLCSARTSSAGPGYHAYLIDVLDRLAERLKTLWISDGEDFGDETGYQEHRSFERLQREMSHHLRKLAEFVFENDAEFQRISLPLAMPSPIMPGVFSITSLGPRDRDWWRDASNDSPDSAREYFVWWDREANADFWLKTGRAVCWACVPWNCPRQQSDRRPFEIAIHCFEQARLADSKVQLPLKDIAEIEMLLRDEEIDHLVVEREGLAIGYYRRPMHRPLLGNWHATVPGYFYLDWENDGETIVFWHENFEFRASVFSYSNKSEADSRIRLPELPEDIEGELIDLRTLDPPAWATLERISNDQDEHWSLHGLTGGLDTLCVSSIYFESEEDRQRAIEMWQSVRHSGS